MGRFREDRRTLGIRSLLPRREARLRLGDRLLYFRFGVLRKVLAPLAIVRIDTFVSHKRSLLEYWGHDRLRKSTAVG